MGHTTTRDDALLCISALLCHLVYFHSPAVFDTRVLCTLGLVLRDTFTSGCHTKFIVLTRGTPDELAAMRREYEEAMALRRISPSQPRSSLAWLATKRRIKRRLEYNQASSLFSGSLFSDSVNDAVERAQLASHLTDRDVFVVFRGTKVKSLLNWQSGADQRMMTCRDIMSQAPATAQAHRGFARAFERIRPRLAASLAVHAARATSHLLMTGHSRGGALAQLAAGAYGDRAPDLVTFGTPACLNADAATHVHDVVRLHVRAAHRSDAVTQMMHAPDHQEYMHVPEKARSVSTTALTPALHATWNPLWHHSMTTYIATVFRLCKLHATLTRDDVPHAYDADSLRWSAWSSSSLPSPSVARSTLHQTKARSSSRPRSRSRSPSRSQSRSPSRSQSRSRSRRSRRSPWRTLRRKK